jgi:hypothetical protein
MAFHARNDGVAPVQTTRNIITSILSAAHEPLPAYPALQSEADFAFVNPEFDFNYFEPATGDHSVLFSVYNKPLLYDWMFAHSLVPEPSGVALWLAAIVILPKIGRRTRLIRDCNRAAPDATIRGAKDPHAN